MTFSIYSIGFLTTILSLILWFYFEKNRTLSSIAKILVAGGLIAYFIGAFSYQADIDVTIQAIVRDLLIMGMTVGMFYVLARKNYTLGTILALAITTLSYYYHEEVLTHTFDEQEATKELGMDQRAIGAFEEGTKLDLEGELLVEVKEGHQFMELTKIIDQYGLEFEKAFSPEDEAATDLDDYYVVNIPTTKAGEMQEIMNQLYQSKLIDWVETNEIIQISDPVANFIKKPAKKKFGLNDPGLGELWAFDAMKMDELYKMIDSKKIKPKKKALIAILDTGVDANHEDIKANFKSISSKSDVDKHGHGTHCAGIAAAVSNNNKGVASFSRNNEFVQVTSVQVLGSFGGTQQSIIKGMILAADKGADVISMSLGGPGTPSRNKVYAKALDYVNKKGAIVVVAAGNSNANAKNYVPAGVDGVIAVAAIDTTLNRAHFSNHVDEIGMGVAAPGVKIYSSIPGNKYQHMNGTSMAAPYVAGLVGLLKSVKPSLTTKEAYKLLHSTGIKTMDNKSTGKLINPKDALSKLL